MEGGAGLRSQIADVTPEPLNHVLAAALPAVYLRTDSRRD
jgi:hypothetical protein